MVWSSPPVGMITELVVRKICSRGSLSRNGTGGSVIVASPSKLTRPRICASVWVVEWMLTVSAPAPPMIWVEPPTCSMLIVSFPPPPEIASVVARSVVVWLPLVARVKPVSETVNVSSAGREADVDRLDALELDAVEHGAAVERRVRAVRDAEAHAAELERRVEERHRGRSGGVGVLLDDRVAGAVLARLHVARLREGQERACAGEGARLVVDDHAVAEAFRRVAAADRQAALDAGEARDAGGLEREGRRIHGDARRLDQLRVLRDDADRVVQLDVVDVDLDDRVEEERDEREAEPRMRVRDRRAGVVRQRIEDVTQRADVIRERRRKVRRSGGGAARVEDVAAGGEPRREVDRERPAAQVERSRRGRS